MARLSPRDYLARALDIIEKRGLRSKEIDWTLCANMKGACWEDSLSVESL